MSHVWGTGAVHTVFGEVDNLEDLDVDGGWY